MRAWSLFALWILVRCSSAQELRVHSVFCGSQIAERDYAVSVSVLESENTGEKRIEVFMDSGHVPSIKYSDVLVRVSATPDDPVEVSPVAKATDDYRLLGDAEQGGSYTFNLKNGSKARAVQVVWRHVTLTFPIPEASASIIHEGDEMTLQVSFASGTVPAVKLQNAELRAFGEHGPKLKVIRQNAEKDATKKGDDREDIGLYNIILEPGQKVGYVFLNWSGKCIQFCDPNIPARREPQ